MKTHTQNPWTRNPQLFVHLTREETEQLMTALWKLRSHSFYDEMSANQKAVVDDMFGHLAHALETARPRGLK